MKPNSGFSQLIILFVVTIVIGAAALFSFASPNETEPIPTPIPSISPEPSPSVQPSPEVATPSASVTTNTQVKVAPPKPGFNLASATLQFGTERRLLTLTGNGFGSNFNKIIFDDDASKYSDYALYNWNNTKIELFLPKEIPDDSNVKVAVIKTDGTKSNTLTFNTKKWDKSANNSFDCKMPSNFRGNAVSSTEVQLNWDTDPNVKRFQVLQHFYTEKGESIWLYPRSITNFENTPNGSVSIKDLTPNSANYFSLTVWCNNGYASAPTPSLQVNTSN